MTKKTHVHLADFSLDILAKRNVQYEALKRSRPCLNSEQGAEPSEGTQMPVFSLAAIYAQITKKNQSSAAEWWRSQYITKHDHETFYL